MIADVRESGADAILSLGEGAARFERAYTACPSPDAGRLAVLNGRYPHFGGLEGGTDLVACFAAAGWKTMRDRLPAGVKRSLAVLEPGPGEDMECLRSALALPGDTLVVFTAARGAASDSWFETSARVPLLFHWPRALAAGDRDELACGVDAMPTILRLCDISPPEGIHGRDLLAPAAESVYVEGRLGKRDEWRMIVRGLDKIVFRPDLRILHLYNLGQDPEEKTDLATALSEQRKRDELMALAELWMKQLDDHIDPSGLKMR
jgi:arylsulfatase A-like enzyme